MRDVNKLELGLAVIFILILGIILITIGILFKSLLILIVGLLLVIPFILWLGVLKKEKDVEKDRVNWLESQIDRDRICLKNIEPVYMKYAEEVTLKEFHKDYRLVMTQGTHGSYTREYLEAKNDLCRKYKKLFFDKDEHIRLEVFEAFSGYKNKEFDQAVIDYINSNINEER